MFLVVSSSIPTPPLVQSCCWLLLVAMTTDPSIESVCGRGESIDKAFNLLAYVLPGASTINDKDYSRSVPIVTTN